MENGQYVPGSVYFYAPNHVAPVVFALLFGLSMILHIWQTIHYKCWKVTFYLPWAAVLFTSGFVVREIGTYHFDNVGLYVASVVLIYAAPPVYELCNYLILSRAFFYVPRHAPIHPGRISTTFSVISALVEVLNIIGAEYSSNAKWTSKVQAVGKVFIKVSLILQLLVLLSFVLLIGTFHWRCAKARPSNLPTKLKSVILTMYCSSALIGFRTVYRTVEYFSILDLHPGISVSAISPLLRYEWFFYVFEASIMVTNSFLLNINHPMKYLPGSKTTQLGEDGTEYEGPVYVDTRSKWQTFVDPFGWTVKKNKAIGTEVTEVSRRVSGEV